MFQARLIDHTQAAKVRLAIRWRVNPEDISDRRARVEIVHDLLTQGEEVVAWMPGRGLVMRGIKR
jgi:hypothetical protein